MNYHIKDHELDAIYKKLREIKGGSRLALTRESVLKARYDKRIERLQGKKNNEVLL